MNVNKKFDRFKQWAGEKMGGEAKTNATEDFRALEMEMNLRHEGMKKLHESMSIYVKSLTKKTEVEGSLPIGYLGSTMVGHGQDFAPDSEFGNCLIHLGRANESLARKQESYSTGATSIWLESLERSLAQMKEYQASRKKLETRRLAYDASLGKMQKAKKEDFRVEEDLRAQKAKYEESSEDVHRRMEDIKDSEVESVADLTNFLETEMEYHQACLEVLLECKRNWPAQTAYGEARRLGRARAGTAHSFSERLAQTNSRESNPYDDEEEVPPVKPPRINTSSSNASIPRLNRTDSIRREYDSPISLSRTSSRQEYPSRPSSVAPAATSYPRGNGSGTTSREYSPERKGYNGTTETSPIFARTPLRPVIAAQRSQDDYSASPISARPANPHRMSSYDSYTGNLTSPGGQVPVLAAGGIKKAPPPPPPARGKKPAPPPPVKRASYQAPAVQGGMH